MSKHVCIMYYVYICYLVPTNWRQNVLVFLLTRTVERSFTSQLPCVSSPILTERIIHLQPPLLVKTCYICEKKSIRQGTPISFVGEGVVCSGRKFLLKKVRLANVVVLAEWASDNHPVISKNRYLVFWILIIDLLSGTRLRSTIFTIWIVQWKGWMLSRYRPEWENEKKCFYIWQDHHQTRICW